MNSHINIVPLSRAVFCVGCEAVSDTTNDFCPRCGETGLLSLARVLDREGPSCHVCGKQMIPKEWECLCCKTTTEVVLVVNGTASSNTLTVPYSTPAPKEGKMIPMHVEEE